MAVAEAAQRPQPLDDDAHHHDREEDQRIGRVPALPDEVDEIDVRGRCCRRSRCLCGCTLHGVLLV